MGDTKCFKAGSLDGAGNRGITNRRTFASRISGRSEQRKQDGWIYTSKYFPSAFLGREALSLQRQDP
ncbi:hypothetical protein KC342_g69 [Hortaea werneckii]|nr:hypothetical protein KC342_g69 [Hortaea werneckii]